MAAVLLLLASDSNWAELLQLQMSGVAVHSRVGRT